MAPYQLVDPKQMSKEEYQKKCHSAWAKPNELCRQMRLHKDIPEIQGHVFFSLHHLLENPLGILDSLRSEFPMDSTIIPRNPNRGEDAAGYLRPVPPEAPKCHEVAPDSVGVYRLTWQ